MLPQVPLEHVQARERCVVVPVPGVDQVDGALAGCEADDRVEVDDEVEVLVVHNMRPSVPRLVKVRDLGVEFSKRVAERGFIEEIGDGIGQVS